MLPLLPHPDPDVRSAAAFVLATATGGVLGVSAALHDRLTVEDDPRVRVSVILAIAQLAREHGDEHAPAWARRLWSDTGRPPEIRIGAALAWLCLVDDPAPAELVALLTDPTTELYGDQLQQVPWIRPVDSRSGLRRCIHDMLTPDVPWNRTRSGGQQPESAITK
ncbi:hypothetical protein WN71_000825 [Streptomyces mangrovisoli]|uniref:HEAT repeat domain-containing protein n=1 Tax=Streptomyces mangrovisoli TaxID=1428628 RepID=A0A1J4P4U3_9ACTN|nr:hypothetical protein WN71_000825 [Streptomyces mangrovisoli]